MKGIFFIRVKIPLYWDIKLINYLTLKSTSYEETTTVE